MAGDDLVTVGGFGDDDGFYEAHSADGVGEVGEAGLVEVFSGCDGGRVD